jgi:hypothetical protein
MEEVQETEKAALLPLDTPRQIALKSPQNTYVYHFRRLHDADWRRYFGAIVNQTVQIDGRRERVFESETASAQLVYAALTRVEGYGDLAGLTDWKLALPLRHRLAAGLVLRNVGALARPQELAPLSELDEVTLDAVWPTDGTSTLYGGLVHRFRHISAEQLKRFNYESARVQVRGDGENAVSVYPARQLIAMSLYDELIESVEGYSVSGAPLEGVEAIRQEMDGAHKAAAILQLFDGSEEIAIQ